VRCPELVCYALSGLKNMPLENSILIYNQKYQPLVILSILASQQKHQFLKVLTSLEKGV